MQKKPRLTKNEMKALYTASLMSAGAELTKNNLDLKVSEQKAHQIWSSAMEKLNQLINFSQSKTI